MIHLLSSIEQIATDAGLEIMRIYNASDVAVTYKLDDSPLTAADSAAHEYIVAALKNLTPDIPIISEESENCDARAISEMNRFWLVDPLDGTKEFLKRTGDFTVNIALIQDSRPVLGVIYVPVQQITYSASTNKGAWKKESSGKPFRIEVRPASQNSLCVVASKDHAGPQVQLMLEKMPGAQLASMGSSLKFCLVAEGKADIYPRFVPTMEWDTAAADCILAEAGGAVYGIDGDLLTYGKVALKNGSIVAIGDTALNWKQFLP